MYHIKMNDGTKIAVYDPNPEGCSPVLLIHGWPLSARIFEYQEEMLLDRGYRVVTMDLRGFGNSDMSSTGYCYDRLAQDVFQVVKCLGLRCFVLGGFSMGGAIALRYMRLFQGYEVRRLLLFAAAAPKWTAGEDWPLGVPCKDAEKMIIQARTDRAQQARTFSHEQLFASPHSEAIKDWFENIAMSASGFGAVQTAVSLKCEDGREDLKAVCVPTAIFQGDKDVVVPNDLTMYQFKHIKGAVLYRFAESGHGIMYDELERFNACLLQELEQCE